MPTTTRGTPSQGPPRTAYTAHEVAAMQRVPVGQIYALIHTDQLRHRRFGKHIRIPFDAVAELLGVQTAQLAELFDAVFDAA